jgi:thioredoxin-like negative regulator of GroEL
LDREADEILDFLAHLCDVLRIQWPQSRIMTVGMGGELARHAASLRRAGRLDEADRKAAFLMALAQRLVQRFPGHQSSYVALSEAFAQQAKNAWKREDMKTIKRALALSIESLQQAWSLDPGDHEIHRKLQDHKRRLDALPRS